MSDRGLVIQTVNLIYLNPIASAKLALPQLELRGGLLSLVLQESKPAMDGGGVDGYGMEMVRNRKVVLRRYVTAGYPTVDDMEVVSSTVMPRVPLGRMAPAVMVKNIYLSCDPWMRGRMTKHDDATAEIAEDFVLGEVHR